MKVKKLGALVELDPTKEYIMLIDADCMSIDAAGEIGKTGVKDGTVIYAHKILEGITFVENSDRIVEIKRKDA